MRSLMIAALVFLAGPAAAADEMTLPGMERGGAVNLGRHGSTQK